MSYFGFGFEERHSSSVILACVGGFVFWGLNSSGFRMIQKPTWLGMHGTLLVRLSDETFSQKMCFPQSRSFLHVT